MGEGVVAASASGEFLVARAARELLGPDGDDGPAALDGPTSPAAPSPRCGPPATELERAPPASIHHLDICLAARRPRAPAGSAVRAAARRRPASRIDARAARRHQRRLAQERVTETARELERSTRELTEFASVASHHLRAPLRSVTSFVSLMEEEADDTFTTRRTYVARMKAAVPE